MTFKATNSAKRYNYGCPYGKTGKYCDECGVTFKDVNTRIVGGEEAVENSWPAHVRFSFN